MEKKRLKDCFGEETMFDYDFIKPADEKLITILSKKYKLEVFREFPKPFFRINKKSKFMLTGVIGLPNVRVTYRKDCPRREQTKLEKILKPYKGQ